MFAMQMAISLKQKILLAAKELFKSYGTQSVSMDDICRELSISKKTIYQEIKDKKELIQAVISLTNKESEQKFKEINQESNDPIMVTILTAKLLIQQMKNASRTLIYDLKKYYPDCFDEAQKFRNSFVYSLAYSNMERGKKLGLYREDIHVSLVTSFYLSLHDEVLAPTQKSDVLLDLKERVNQLMEYHLHAVCSAKGLELLEKYKNDKDLWL